MPSLPTRQYVTGAELPDLPLVLEIDGVPLNLAAGYTFQLTLVDSSGLLVLTKTTGITGGNGDPSATVQWSGTITEDLNQLDPGKYKATFSYIDGETPPKNGAYQFYIEILS